MITYGKSIISGDNVGFNEDRLLKIGKNANIITVGKTGTGKTHSVLSKIQQLNKQDSVKTMIISDNIKKYIKEYADILIDITTFLKYNSNDVESRLWEIIYNIQDTSKERIWIFIDVQQNINGYMENIFDNLYIRARLNNCIINRVYRRLTDVNDIVLMNSEIFEICNITKEEQLYLQKILPFNKLIHKIDLSSLRQNEEALIINTSTTIIEQY